jgi:hypothetical protein
MRSIGRQPTRPSRTTRSWSDGAAGLLARLLGPAGPELTCEECFEQLERYVELQRSERDPDAAVPHMRAHLEGCPACREDCESLAALLWETR